VTAIRVYFKKLPTEIKVVASIPGNYTSTVCDERLSKDENAVSCTTNFCEHNKISGHWVGDVLSTGDYAFVCVSSNGYLKVEISSY
jgi:hypothetical protein